MDFDKNNLVEIINNKIFKGKCKDEIILYDKNKKQSPETEIELFELLTEILYKNIYYNSSLEDIKELQDYYKLLGFNLIIHKEKPEYDRYSMIVFKEDTNWELYLTEMDLNSSIILNSIWEYKNCNDFKNIYIIINGLHTFYISFEKIY